jgi:hypothetical protein
MLRTLPIAALLVLSVWRPWPSTEPVAPLASERALASLVPARCLVYLEAAELAPLLEAGLAHPFVRTLRHGELVRALEGSWKHSPEAALSAADAWLGSPLTTTAGELCARGLALAFDPATEGGVVLTLGRDGATVERELTRVLDALERQLGWSGGLDAPNTRWSGADVWRLGEVALARRDALLVLGNDEELVAEVLELAGEPEADGLLGRPGFERHHQARPPGSTAWAWLELTELEAHGDDGYRALRAANRSPAVQGLLGADLAALLSARAVSVALLLGEEELELRARAFEAPRVVELAPHARPGSLPATPGSPGLADALVYRDYARYFTQRGQLFEPEVLPKFAEAITTGALFFEGEDLGEAVLARLSPWLRLCVRPLAFEDALRPEIPLPGAAVVAVLDDPRAGEPWLAAFQSLVALANVDRAQRSEAALRLQLVREGEVEISAARFATPRPGEGVDVRYNLEPAAAVVGRHLVLGTHLGLVLELVRELEGREPEGAEGAREELTLESAGWRAALAANQGAYVANAMLSKGLSRAAAEDEFAVLGAVLATLAGVRLEQSEAAPGEPELRLSIALADGKKSEER